MNKHLLHPQTAGQIDLFLARPGHGLGLSGSEGSGKMYLARHIMSTLLGLRADALDQHSYLLIIDGQNPEGIDQVRKLQSFLALKVPGTQKIRRGVIIDSIGLLKREAQNALLKTLEEPPDDTLIIVTTTVKHKNLATIVSRLQWIDVLPLSLERAVKELSDTYTETAIKRAYYVSGGAPGLLIGLLSNDDSHPLMSSIEQAKEILRLSRYDQLAKVETLTKDKTIDPKLLVDGMYRVLQAALTVASHKDAPDKKALRRLVAQIKHVIHAKDLLNSNAQPKLVLTWLFQAL